MAGIIDYASILEFPSFATLRKKMILTKGLNPAYWEEHFFGRQLDTMKWLHTTFAGVATSTLTADDSGVCRMTCSGNGIGALNWNDIRSLLASKNVIAIARLKKLQLDAQPDGFQLRGIVLAGTDAIYWSFHGTGVFHIGCIAGGVTTDVNTTVAYDTNYHTYMMICTPTSVRFLYDFAEITGSPVTTNIPTVLLQPHLIKFSGVPASNMDIDYFAFNQDD